MTEERQQRWFNIIDIVTKLIEVEVEVDFPRDQKDAKFIACAIAANADFLITGDRDFTEAQIVGNTTIISVSLASVYKIGMTRQSFSHLDSN